MDLRIGQIAITGTTPPAPRRPAVTAADFGLPGPADTAIPDAPPPDVLREVQAASLRAEELWNARRELHFQMDEDTGRVVVQVRDLEGNVIRTIPPSEALDIMSGRGI
jgi:FlaG protein